RTIGVARWRLGGSSRRPSSSGERRRDRARDARGRSLGSIGIACAVVVDSALRRRYPVSCALQVGNGVLPRLRPRAFLARSLRRPPGEDGPLELLPSRHWATPIFPADPANQTYSARRRDRNRTRVP